MGILDQMVVRVVISLGLIAYVCFSAEKSIKNWMNYRKQVKEFYKDNKDVELYKESTFWWVGLGLLSLIGFAMAISASMFVKADELYYIRLAYFCLAIVFAGLAFDTYTRKRLYFSHDGFLFADGYFRFRSIMDIQQQNGLTRTSRILMVNSQKLIVSHKMAVMIDDHRLAWKKAKKVKKK